MDTSFHPLISRFSREKECSSKFVSIGNNCWLASRVACLPGCQIPDFSTIALGSIVKKQLKESYVLYGDDINIHPPRFDVYFDQDESKDPLEFGA